MITSILHEKAGIDPHTTFAPALVGDAKNNYSDPTLLQKLLNTSVRKISEELVEKTVEYFIENHQYN